MEKFEYYEGLDVRRAGDNEEQSVGNDGVDQGWWGKGG